MSSSDRVRANAERLPYRRDMTSYDALSEEAFERLRGGAQAFNAWRLGNVETRLDFRKRVFSRGVEDAPSVFEPDPTQGYSGCWLVNADLREASFEEAVVDGALFGGSDLTAADFYGGRGDHAVFGVPELLDTKIPEAVLSFVLKPARLGGACLMGSRFMGANFREVQLSGADFRGAFLEHADFRGAHFEGARFEDARLGRTLFSP